MIKLKSCLKTTTRDLDKAVPPEETVARVKKILGGAGQGVLKETRRIDTGRLGIPVFVSMCGDAARRVMPVRKQMGKGASPAQAEASALMELVERYSFFSFWEREDSFFHASYSEAEKARPGRVVDIRRIMESVQEDMDPSQARRIMDLTSWRFCQALNVPESKMELIPLDWFRKLGEFNGSSAGNTPEESILQGGCELVERHVCAVIDQDKPELATISTRNAAEPVLADLIRRFEQNGIKILLKDFSLGMPVPTVGALAHDPKTFPGLSEIVFTAGTASCPVKAAIRALTEVAQLGGDFETGAVYEASGLSKFSSPEEYEWLTRGATVGIDSLPSIESPDILDELNGLAQGLSARGYSLYAVDLTSPELGLSAHYNIAPGFRFRERDKHQSLGLFVGRILAEEADPAQAADGLNTLKKIYGQAHYLPFFEGMLELRAGDPLAASQMFLQAEPLQPDAEKQAMAAFYHAYSLTALEDWENALPALDRAVDLHSEVKEYFNLRGVTKFKQARYEEAAEDFSRALDLDRGSAMDLANLGVCHKHLGNKEKARDYLQSAISLDPSLEFVHNHLNDLDKC